MISQPGGESESKGPTQTEGRVRRPSQGVCSQLLENRRRGVGGLRGPKVTSLKRSSPGSLSSLVCTSFITADHLREAKWNEELPSFRAGDRCRGSAGGPCLVPTKRRCTFPLRLLLYSAPCIWGPWPRGLCLICCRVHRPGCFRSGHLVPELWSKSRWGRRGNSPVTWEPKGTLTDCNVRVFFNLFCFYEFISQAHINLQRS